MRILLSAFSFLFLFPAHLLAQGESEIRAYIEQYKDLAIAEQIRVGVPAAITLAQGIHESSAGLSELATKGNNHFGIKCKSTWTGMTILHDDDKKQECFRKYTSSEQSYIDHSEFLKGSNRYHFLFDLDKTDYQGWASGLKRAGYATNPAYVQKLTDLVEKFNLQQYTYEALSKTKIRVGETVPEKDAPRNLTYIEDPASSYKGLKGFWAKKGETLLSYATDRNIRYARLLALNDLNDEALPINMFIFTEKKRRMGTEEFHVVKENENMLIISQKEAMLLSALYEFNNLQPGQEPLPGERLCLQYRSYETPKIKQQFLNELPVSQDNKPRESVVVIREETAPAKKTKEDWSVQIPPAKTVPAEKQVEKNVEPPKEEKPQPVGNPVVQSTKSEPRMDTIQITTKLDEPVKEMVVTEAPKEEVIVRTEPAPKTETEKVAVQEPVIQEENKNILDPDKAARMEQMLNSERLEKKNDDAIVIHTATKTENPPVRSEPKTEVIPPPQVPVRTYNETGVADTTKNLKKKFDQIVYSQKPLQRRDTVKANPATTVTPVPVAPAKNVTLTPTGVKRTLVNGKPAKNTATTPAKSNKKEARGKDTKAKTPAAKSGKNAKSKTPVNKRKR